ncbi:MAG: hypothetical protein K9M98_05525 [Cephaloticoccus sp.]|nr:hypothetical protein [Cephaloticoccus sp.]MCF7759944.1 hypothetical protein [Cephaloticoccus sp.]
MRLILFLLFLLAATGPATAQSFLQTKPTTSSQFPSAPGMVAPHPWPGQSRYKFNVTRYVGRWDEMPIGYKRLRIGPLDLQLRESDLSDWFQAHGGDYSLNLTFRWNKNISAYLAWFPTGIFLDDLNDDTWSAYVSTIPQKSERKTALMINDDSETNRDMIRILDARTRVLVYHELNAETGQNETTHVQIFVRLADGILVLGLEGPTKLTTGQASRYFSQLVLGIGPYVPVQ